MEAKEAKQKPAIEQKKPNLTQNIIPNAAAYNAATGSYSGLYGQGPVDESTKATLDAIMNTSSSQNTVDSLLSSAQPQKKSFCHQNRRKSWMRQMRFTID